MNRNMLIFPAVLGAGLAVLALLYVAPADTEAPAVSPASIEASHQSSTLGAVEVTRNVRVDAAEHHP